MDATTHQLLDDLARARRELVETIRKNGEEIAAMIRKHGI